jgi:histidyl-tRNA synthetase|tara:strand:+ start:2835 stop:3050 length:216 start_codon:yes stop_codon:yes gene_type:complete
MNQLNEAELQYEGYTDSRRKDQQLEAAVKALHAIAVILDGDSRQSAQIAIDALNEMETYGYYYEQFVQEYD